MDDQREDCRRCIGKTPDGWPVVCNRSKGHSGAHDWREANVHAQQPSDSEGDAAT